MTFLDRLLHRRDADATHTRRAPAVAVTSWNAEARTFTAVLSTGAPVERQDARGAFDELLDLNSASLPDRIPLLDSHARDSVDRVLGHVANMRVVNGELVGTVTLSRHNPQAQRLAQEISDGARFGLSVGYRVRTYRDGMANGRRTRTAAAWDVLEASLVAVGADDRAGMREESEMTTRTNTGTRADVNREIRNLASTAGLTREWADSAIDRELTPEAARAEAFEAMRQRGSAAAGIQTFTSVHEHDDRDGRVRAMGEALYARVTPSHRPSDRARQYVGMRIPDLARECLRAVGVSTTGLSDAIVIERAGMHTTSDFPQVLGDTVGRSLRTAYTAAPSALRQLARQRTATDFRMQHRLLLSTGTFRLLKVNEAGEFKEGSIVEGGEAYKVDTFGRIFSISRQALVNDNLGAFGDLPRTLGTAAAALEADVLASLVSANPIVMSDGKTVFHADHGNVGTPGAISIETLSEARLAMRRQRGPGGEVLNIVPRYLVVAPEDETAARQMTTAVTAGETANVNPFSDLVVIVEPRLPDGAWFVVADPATADGLEYAFLEGEDGPQVITEQGFDVDGVRIRVRHDFGGGWVDWRSWFSNTGGAA